MSTRHVGKFRCLGDLSKPCRAFMRLACRICDKRACDVLLAYNIDISMEDVETDVIMRLERCLAEVESLFDV